MLGIPELQLRKIIKRISRSKPHRKGGQRRAEHKSERKDAAPAPVDSPGLDADAVPELVPNSNAAPPPSVPLAHGPLHDVISSWSPRAQSVVGLRHTRHAMPGHARACRRD